MTCGRIWCRNNWPAVIRYVLFLVLLVLWAIHLNLIFFAWGLIWLFALVVCSGLCMWSGMLELTFKSRIHVINDAFSLSLRANPKCSPASATNMSRYSAQHLEQYHVASHLESRHASSRSTRLGMLWWHKNWPTALPWHNLWHLLLSQYIYIYIYIPLGAFFSEADI